MDWLSPKILLLILPLVALLIAFDGRSTHPMGFSRRRALLIVRSLLVLLALAAFASPARLVTSRSQATVFLLDHSLSQGGKGVQEDYQIAQKLVHSASPTSAGYVAFGEDARLLVSPAEGGKLPDAKNGIALMSEIGAGSNYEQGVRFARSLFPGGSARHIVIIGDGVETRGSLMEAAEEASVAGIKIHAIGVAGAIRPDVRVTRLVSSQSRVNEGASIELEATVETSLSGPGRLRLFENGIEVASESLDLKAGEALVHRFRRSPEKRNIYNYRAVIEGFDDRDAIPENNEALCIVDVQGRSLFLYVEGEEGEARYLVKAMEKEEIRLDVRSPEDIPDSLQELSGFDGIILSDVAAHRIGESRMAKIRDYVEKLGGGFVMIGGMNSFGAGGYYRTPIEDLLPVKLKAPDQEELQSSALALVVDRSGSMAGQKIEICKSAAIASAELLTNKDSIGVYAFDSQVHEIVPMTRVTSISSIAAQIKQLSSGGGTNIYPGMVRAREELGRTKAKIKHMIVLTDGQTSGEGYQALASQCHAEGITISTVAVGAGAQVGLLQSIAAAGGGQSYVTMDPASIVRIFTQDTLTHTGRMIREEPFSPKLVEKHPMLRDWKDGVAPPLLGYVKTNRKVTAQVPLVADGGDPLLATWRFGLGKATAFTSDCKSRWAALWVSDWDGYSRLWAQILRETARAPQGLNMDMQLGEEGSDITISVDLATDAGTRLDGATVEAEVFHIPASSLSSAMKSVATLTLPQEGPGWYQSRFRATESGAYLVRARSGSHMVSAGYIHNPSTEVATGQVNDDLLRKVCEITGGTYLESPDQPLVLSGQSVASHVELWPWLMKTFLVILLIDLCIRRWENVLGVVDLFLRRRQEN